MSCRDPLAEFSEVLVAELTSAELATSRVQRLYDLTRPNGRRVQVRYLANPGAQWINEHRVHFEAGLDDYALVIYVGFRLEAVLIFSRETIGQVCAALGKRHPDQNTTLQFTQRNYAAIVRDHVDFRSLGVDVFLFPDELDAFA